MKLLKFCLIAALSVSWSAFAANLAIIDTSGDEIYIEGIIAGGSDCYSENAKHQGGKDRIIADPMEVVAKEPDIIIGSWCGRRFHPQKVGEREGWSDVPAVMNNEVYEVKSAVILQPGPAALTEGLDQLFAITKNWQAKRDSFCS